MKNLVKTNCTPSGAKKNSQIFKSGFCEKLKLLLIPIGLLMGSITMQVWADAWYSHNNASTIYFNDYNSQWVADPSSDGITFLMGRDYQYGNNGGTGSQAYRMQHIEHTKLWYCNVPAWSSTDDNDKYQYVAFRFAPGTTGWNDWQGGSENRVSARSQYGSNTKYSITVNDNITGRTKFYEPSSSDENTSYAVNSEAGIASFKYTAYLRVNIDEEGDGTYDGGYTGGDDGKHEWPHGISFDFTGTYLNGDNVSTGQSTIPNLNKNGWDDNGNWQWKFSGIPKTGEVTFLLKSIDTGFEIAGWAWSMSASAPNYTENLNNPTFEVLSDESFYVAMIRRKSYTITLNDNGGSGGSGSKTVIYDRSTNMTSNVTVPTRTGYRFQGYYTAASGGTQIIDANGAWKKGVTDYTGTDESYAKWIRDESVELYAHWTAETYSGRLVEADGSTVNGSYEVTYSDTKITITSEPSKAGYEVEGYFKEYTPKLDVQVAEEDGDLLASRTYTDAEHKWIYSSAPDLYIKWEGKQYNITLDRQGGTTGSTSFTVTMGHNDYSAITVPTRAGYEFKGYYTNDVTPVLVIQANGNKNTGTTYINGDGNWIYAGNVTLYAHWDPVGLTSSANGNWNTASTWEPACVPTIEHAVTIAHAVSVSDAQVAKSVDITTGTLTIASTGALEVAGAITNTDPSKLVVEARGALIFNNSEGTTQATVEMSLTPANWQMVAIPVGYVDVKDAFVGSSVYTYVWKYGEGWERRGYYDGLSAFESVLITGCTGTTFSGALVSTADQSFTALYNESKESGDVTMFGNSWTAPIAVSGMTLTNIVGESVHTFNGSSWEGGIITDYIPALQGFAVVANSDGGSVTIPYSAVRAVPNANRNTALRAPKRATSDIPDPISIYISGNEWKNRIRLFENEQFSDEIDEGYEAIYMDGEGIAGELYAQAERKMNVLATNNLEGTVLGFVPGEAANYTISFEGDGRGYYLNDMLTQQSTLIAEGNTYQFNPDAATNATRFVISRTPLSGSTATGVDLVNEGTHARKQMINGVLYIIREGKIYEVTGKLVK